MKSLGLPIPILAGFSLLPGRPTGQVAPSVRDTFQRANLASDPRLEEDVSLQLKSATLAECISNVAMQTGTPLSVSTDISDRRATVMVGRMPARKLLRAIARVFQFEWRTAYRIGGDPTTAFELFRTKEAEEYEEALKHAYQRRVETDTARHAHDLSENIFRAAQTGDRVSPALAQLLGSLSRDQVSRVATLAEGPHRSDLIGSPDSLIFATPFSRLPETVSGALTDSVSSRSFSAAGIAPPTSNARDLEKCFVGIAAVGGSVRLAVVRPNGAPIWNSGPDAVYRGYMSGDDVALDADHSSKRGKLLNAEGIPASNREAHIRFASDVNRRRLGDVLEALWKQRQDQPIVSDDYLAGSTNQDFRILPSGETSTFVTSLDVVAEAFRHRIDVEDGVLLFRSATLGRDLAADPPASLFSRMRTLARKHDAYLLEDYISIGRLSPLQFRSLALARIPDCPPRGIINAVDAVHPVLHLYSMLPVDLRHKAESPSGLHPNDMSRIQREAFDRVKDVGIPVSDTATGQSRRAGLYVKREKSESAAVKITFTINSQAGRATRHTLVALGGYRK